MTERVKSGSNTSLSPLKQAFLALEQAQARIRELESDRQQPIAIVGMGCRIPGHEDGVEGYRKLLWERQSAVSEGVEKRLADSLQGDQLPVSARRAALLERVDLFDPRHFGISPREAAGMDPQQRLLLEVSWEALENAAIDPFALYQSATGVYVGISSHDYAQLQMRSGNEHAINPHFASGSAASVAAGRISYVLGLNGPSVSIDTACSSSLVAVHLACEALRHRECTTALAGGVNLILSSEPSIAFARAGMLSEKGVCSAFDASADGFVRGEGCGVLVLKRVADAERDGDRILGVILGSAVNQDGASSGLTVPNGLAQQALLREAHRRAGVEPWQVGYVEAHGTGTALGDPIEAEALGAVFGEGRARERKLPIGSVKTNVGHLESAAGVAGLIKIVLGLGHGVIPAQLNWERPSEHVRWSELPLEVVTEARAWEPIDGRRIGGVSSFGFSGTNAHVVVEGWVQPASASSEPNNTPREEVLVITARSMAALRALAERYAALLHETDSSWSDVCYTAAIGRAVFAERLALVAAGKQEAAEKLLGWLRGESRAQVFQGEVSAGHRAGGEVFGVEASNETIAAQFVRGARVDWMARSAGRKLRRAALPTYAFQRERYWIEAAQNTQAESGEPTGRALLGRRLRVAGVRAQFASLLRADSWIGEHVVEGRVVLPATGHLELMLEAGAEVFGAGCALADVVLESPLIIDSERGVQTVVEEESNGRSRVRIYAEQGTGEWERVSEGWLLRDEAQTRTLEKLDIAALRARLQPREAAQPFYAEMSARGLEFGARFRGVERLWSGDGEALGEIAALDFATTGFEVQPWWLDACLQVAGAASSGEDDGLYLPMSVGRLNVYAGSDSDAGPGSDKRQQQPGNASRSWSHITTHRIDTETLTTRVTIIDQHGVPRLRLDDLRFRKAVRNAADVASWMYRLDWRRNALLGAAQRSAIGQAVTELEAHAKQLSSTPEIGVYGEFFAELEALSAAYVVEAFRQLGWPEVEASLSARVLQDRWKIVPQHERLLTRLLEIAVETGAVRREADQFAFFGAAPAPMNSDRVEHLLHRFPFGSTEVHLVDRCGRHLAHVLTGKVDGRELVFPGGQSDEMTRLYRDAVPARIYNEMAANVVARVVSARGGAATRILEVGGGTGATTEYVLKALQSDGLQPMEYVFTDISLLLVRRAAQAFENSAFLRTHVFDLERDGTQQGIEGLFSVVLAVNVVHATADISATLDRLKQMLAPDGVLILVEVTGKQRWADITVGLLDGWWNSVDRSLRPDYPALESGAWKSLLEEAGFETVQTIPNSSDGQSIFARQELIVASAPAQTRNISIVGTGQLAERVAIHLRRRGAVVHFLATGAQAPRIVSDDRIDAVLLISENLQNFELVAPGSASRAIESSVSSLLATAQSVLKNDARRSPRLYVVTCGACAVGEQEAIQLAATPLLGLATALASEVPELRCTRLDCSDRLNETDGAEVAAEVLSNADDTWVAWRAGERYVARLVRMSNPSSALATDSRVQLKSGTGIEMLKYIPAARMELQPDEVEIQVHATALNFRDVLQSLGVVKLDGRLGADCAGVVLRTGAAVTDLAAGDEVVAIAPGCFASHAVAHQALVVRKPPTLSFAEAAAQSMAYLTADYCLTEAARVHRGERVLIHAAAGGVGLAAVHLCMRAGAQIVATAGSEKKRAFLTSLGIEQVYDSRSLHFAGQISGQVDIVLNSLAGDAVDAGLSLLRPGGRFIELGKTDLRDPVVVAEQWPHVRYLPVDLTPLLIARSHWVRERLAQLLKTIAEGSLPALPVTAFDAAKVKDAFHFMARAEHVGRIVVETKHAGWFRGVHLVTGGIRGIGLKLAEWLCENGARELVLVGRHAPEAAAGRVIARLQAEGVSVRMVQGDVADPDIAAMAIQWAGRDLRGVWHCAGVLDNASLHEQSWERMRAVFRPKGDGAWNLHSLTRAMQLDYFVLFSSWASIGGSYGQANHCAANAFLDGLAHWRRAKGLAALSVNWGAWGETGAASGDEVARQLVRLGIEKMAPASALEALRLALLSGEAQVAVAAVQWPRYLRHRGNDRLFFIDVISESEASGERKQSGAGATLTRHTAAAQADGAAGAPLDTILATPIILRESALMRMTGDLVRKTLDLHLEEEIDPDAPLSDLGMDSLLAIELRNSLSGALRKQFPSTILFDYPTLRTLVGYLAREILNQDAPSAVVLSPAPAPGRAKETSLDILDTIEQMSDDEVESWFN